MRRIERRTLVAVLAALPLAGQQPAPMNRYDPSSTAANTRETVLNAANVQAATFGKLFSYYVDGAVFAQPLYVPGLRLPGRRPLNVLYVATMNDKVYAFDADQSGPPLWRRDLTDEMAGVTPVPVSDITNNPALNIVGNVGILGTPVIDLETRALYLVARTKERGHYVQRLHKLSLLDGKDERPAAVIQASVPGTAQDAIHGMVAFDPRAGNQRTALALANGSVVIAWASHEDIKPYHGWIMTYDAATLKQTGALCVTPDGEDGGIWQSGRAPAIDRSGAIYFETGNGDWDGKRNFGTSVLKLRLGKNGLAVEDSFTPHDYEALNRRDADLGSTGPLLIPGADLLLAGSKAGILYLLDTRKLGGMTPSDSSVLQALEVNGGRILPGPAYWDGPAGPVLFLWSESDVLKAFRFHGRILEAEPAAKGTVASRGSPGGSLTVSSDGKKPGTGIVWATLTNGQSANHGNAAGVLRAYNAETLQEIWNSEQQRRRDRLGSLMKFNPPLVEAGKVYVPNYDNAVNVYGLLPPAAAGQ